MASLARSLARPFVATGHWYSDVAKKRPVVTAVITTGLKTSAADLFAQKVIAFFDFEFFLFSLLFLDASVGGGDREKKEGGAPREPPGPQLHFDRGDREAMVSRAHRRTKIGVEGGRGRRKGARQERAQGEEEGLESSKRAKTTNEDDDEKKKNRATSYSFFSLSHLVLFLSFSLKNNNRCLSAARRSTGVGTSPFRPLGSSTW